MIPPVTAALTETDAPLSTGGTLFDEKPNTQASELIHDILEQDGLKPLSGPLKIGLEGYKPPPKLEKGALPDSEIERARDFGREIGARLAGTGPAYGTSLI